MSFLEAGLWTLLISLLSLAWSGLACERSRRRTLLFGTERCKSGKLALATSSTSGPLDGSSLLQMEFSKTLFSSILGRDRHEDRGGIFEAMAVVAFFFFLEGEGTSTTSYTVRTGSGFCSSSLCRCSSNPLPHTPTRIRSHATLPPADAHTCTRGSTQVGPRSARTPGRKHRERRATLTEGAIAGEKIMWVKR